MLEKSGIITSLSSLSITWKDIHRKTSLKDSNNEKIRIEYQEDLYKEGDVKRVWRYHIRY